MTFTFINVGVAEVMMLIVAAPIIALGMYTIYQCLRNPDLTSAQRILWLIIILAVPLFGCLGYLVSFKNAKRHN